MRRPLATSLMVVAWLLFATGWLAGSGEAQRDRMRHGTIAFVRGPFGFNGRLYFVNADGGRLRGSGIRADGFPAWSPDGSKLAFFAGGAGARLYVTDAGGGRRRAITKRSGESCYWLSWSPDGRRIAYTLNDGCGGLMSVRVVGADGVGDRGLVPGEGVFDPVWSPDGKAILYSGYAKQWPRTRLFLVDADGGRGRPLPGPLIRPPGGTPMRPVAAWAANGHRIYFVGGDNSLWTMNRDGSGKRNLTPDLTVVSFDLSPDERKIALSADTASGRDIYLLHLDSRKIEKLAGGNGPEADPRWSPDGRLIAFTRRPIWGAQADIYVMDAVGKHQTRITHSPLDDVAPAWRPAG